MKTELPDLSHVSLEQTSLRRVPSQQRSRERVERMLDTAIAVIAEKGSDAMKMSEVARLAEVSIGSLYQYFPDKSAIIRTLAEHYAAECRKCIRDGLAEATSLDELCTAFGELIDVYYALFLAEPVIRDISSAVQADKALSELELQESRRNGAVLAEAMRRVNPKADAATLSASGFLIMQLGEATMRLAISVDRTEGERLVETYKRMAMTELRHAVGGA